jgi:hypothetical protein
MKRARLKRLYWGLNVALALVTMASCSKSEGDAGELGGAAGDTPDLGGESSGPLLGGSKATGGAGAGGRSTAGGGISTAGGAGGISTGGSSTGGAVGGASASGGAGGENGALRIDRSAYADRLRGFWLGACIANWTGLQTEGWYIEPPYLTDDDWDGYGFVLSHEGEVWAADDDTDIEYVYQHLLTELEVTVLTPEQIREGWLAHFNTAYIWVSNAKAYELMVEGNLPPTTGSLPLNDLYDQIDAQLTTEIFGLFSPARTDIALKLADMPVRTVAALEAEDAAKFYVLMHSLASAVDPNLSMAEKTRWLAAEARRWLPADTYITDMYDWVWAEYQANSDKDDWEATRDALYLRYVEGGEAGYVYKNWYDSGINFGASLISLFYGEGDYQRTVRIGTLSGWDSDNPTATWGGLLGFLLGDEALRTQFPDLSEVYWIYRTRFDLPDYLPDADGEDTFPMMAERGLQIIDRVVTTEMGGEVVGDEWVIPNPGPHY